MPEEKPTIPAGENNNNDTDTNPVNPSNTNEDGAEEETASSNTSKIGNLTSPDGILNLIIAGFFDGIGFIPVVNMVSDIIAAIYFIIWMLGTGKKGWLKLILAVVLMFIPIVSDIAVVVGFVGLIMGVKLPVSWTGFVYSTMTSSDFAGGKTPAPTTLKT